MTEVDINYWLSCENCTLHNKHNLMANGRRPYTQDNRPNNGLPYYSVPAGDSYWVGPELDKGMIAYQWPYFDANGELTARALESHPDNAWSCDDTGPGYQYRNTRSGPCPDSRKEYAGWSLNRRDPS